MTLPALTIPQFPLPVHIPFEAHPCIVHLAVALPIVIILMELVNLVVKKRTLGVFSFVLMILLALILFAAYLTGSVDAEHAKSALTQDAKSLFEAHKVQGVYLVYGAAVLVLIKLMSVLIRKTPMRVIFLLFLLAFTALTLNTAKKGKILVFDYGVNVKTAAPVSAPSPAVKAPGVSKESAGETMKDSPAASRVQDETEAATPASEETKRPERPKGEGEGASANTPSEESASPEAQEVNESMQKVTQEPMHQAQEALPEAPEAPEAPSK